MVTPVQIRRKLEQFKGLDLFRSELTRDTFSASKLLNAQFTLRRSLALTKRKGYKIASQNKRVRGIARYSYIDKTTGNNVVEIIGAGVKLQKLNKGTMQITYSGSGTTVIINVFLSSSTNTYHLTLSVDGVQKTDQNLGTGKEGVPLDMNNLVSNINAVADFSATITSGIGTASAATIELMDNVLFSSNTVDVPFTAWEDIPDTFSSDPFTGIDSDDDSIAQFANVNDVLYIATSQQYLVKYDSVRCYRAGIIKGKTPSLAVVNTGTGALTGKFKYKITYENKDAQLNIIEGDVSDEVEITANTEDIDVTITPVNEDGYNTVFGTVNGNQIGVNTITVSSHNFVVGDTAYFLDRSSGNYVERDVTATTGTSITIDGAAVNVNNGDPISNNLKINIWRTTDLNSNPGSEFYLVATIPNHSPSSTQVFRDTTPDSTLIQNAVFIEPSKIPGIPPKGTLIHAFQGTLLIAGNKENPTTVFYSDLNPENFPDLNSFDVLGKFGGKITALSDFGGSAIIFKDKGIFGVSGDLSLDSFRVDRISEGSLGTLSPDSVIKLNVGLIFLSEHGFRLIQSDGTIADIGQNINPLFDINADIKLDVSKARAILDPFNDMFLCFIPNMVSSVPTGESKVMALDLREDRLRAGLAAWFEWKNINALGGFVIDDRGVLYHASIEDNSSGYLYQRHTIETGQAYADQENPIDFHFIDQWDSLGAPSISKHFGRMKIYSLHPDIASTFDLTFNAVRDYIEGKIHTSKTLSFGTLGTSGGYGKDAYGTSPYGNPASNEVRIKLKRQKVKALKFEFRNNTLFQNILISGYEYEAYTPYKPKVDRI